MDGYVITPIVVGGCLVPVYCVVLYKVRQGTSYKFVSKVVMLLLASNVALAIWNFLYFVNSRNILLGRQKRHVFDVCFFCFFMFISDALFTQAHWSTIRPRATCPLSWQIKPCRKPIKRMTNYWTR